MKTLLRFKLQFDSNKKELRKKSTNVLKTAVFLLYGYRENVVGLFAHHVLCVCRLL